MGTDIQMYKCKYFKINELVHPDLLKQFGEAKCWMFFDERLLRFIDWLREQYGSIVINSATLKNCGARPIGTSVGAGFSAHKLWRAFDCHIVNIEKKAKNKKEKANLYKEVRQRILKEKDWSFICFETTTENKEAIWWLHVDTYNRPNREYNA